MPKKPKFKPEISRIKLNVEQAVLTCSCYSGSFNLSASTIGPQNYSGCYDVSGSKASGPLCAITGSSASS